MAQGKNPLIAAILSLILAGLGQLYVNRFRRAAMFLFLEITTAMVYFLTRLEIGAILNLLVSIWAAYDAYEITKRINRNKKFEKADIKGIPELYIND